MTDKPAVSRVRAGVLDVSLLRTGNPDGWPVVLLHGFPYDARGFDAVTARLAEAGAFVVTPWLRGFGGTRFIEASTMRSGQQAAVAHDLLDLLTALGLEAPVIAGYDWGGRAACVVAALWPERVGGLVSGNGYLLQDIAAARHPDPPDLERRHWYQYYLHGERGEAGLREHRAELARLLWEEWSPTWTFSDSEFEATRPAFSNPDFVEVVLHSYRHRYGLAAGDPAYAETERRIAELPPITVPTVVVDGRHDTVTLPQSVEEHAHHFPALVDYALVDAGHALPQEAPEAFADAVLRLRP
ncbi:alpha/beta fold hydrolase [Nocardioides sp. SYSU D00038]|uniref:alpha/beta fold hydrolase n=1 Tax=Nocardioides sp. SYSU D00038 TaxID=2812554 RepID=UPI001967D099|nr:alpha/beta hydrolase [Nocardioides sp. SYSU D00038]